MSEGEDASAKIKLPEAPADFSVGDAIHVIDEDGAIVSSGTIESIRKCPERWAMKIFTVNGNDYALNFSHYALDNKFYAVFAADLDACQMPLARAKIGVCDALFNTVLNLDLPADKFARMSALIDALHHEIVDGILSVHNEIPSLSRTICKMSGHEDITDTQIKNNLQLSLAKLRRERLS